MNSMIIFPRRWFEPQDAPRASRRPVRDDIDALCENINGPTICQKSMGDGKPAQSRSIPTRGGGDRRKAEFLPCADLSAREDAYILSMELPGVIPECVSFSLNGNILLIAGEKSSDGTGERMLSERVYGTFSRSWTLPVDADTDNITASHANGVLNVTVPRKIRLEYRSDESGQA